MVLFSGPDNPNRVWQLRFEQSVSNADMIRAHLERPVERRAAGRTEEILDHPAGIGLARPTGRCPVDLHLGFAKIPAGSKRRAGAFLTGLAIANDDKVGIAFETGGQRSTLTGCAMRGHGHLN